MIDHLTQEPETQGPESALLPTKCPFTFKEMPADAVVSPYVEDREEYQLPEGWQGSGTITFAMAGDRSSGKSLYIAVIVKLLRKLVIANGGSFRSADEHTRRIYEDKYENPLFAQMGLLPPTPPASSADAHQTRPLIFDVSTPAHQGQRLFVVFRDVAGEDLQEENFAQRQSELDFFKYADRIIFLFDPMAVPRIRQLLEGSVESPEVGEDGPTIVLRNVLRVLGEEHRPKISLCLSKFDTMQRLSEVNQQHLHYSGPNMVNWQRVMRNFGATFRRDSAALDQPFDRTGIQLLDLEIRSMLECLDATQLLNQLNQPLLGVQNYDFSCFAVSALGAPPEGDRIARTGIAPFRCLDPIREVLAEHGLFNGPAYQELPKVMWGNAAALGVAPTTSQFPGQFPGQAAVVSGGVEAALAAEQAPLSNPATETAAEPKKRRFWRWGR